MTLQDDKLDLNLDTNGDDWLQNERQKKRKSRMQQSWSFMQHAKREKKKVAQPKIIAFAGNKKIIRFSTHHISHSLSRDLLSSFFGWFSLSDHFLFLVSILLSVVVFLYFLFFISCLWLCNPVYCLVGPSVGQV